MGLRLSCAEYSASGPRAENQDAVRLVTPAPSLAGSKGFLFALADGVSQCADGGLAARSTLQALAHDYYATPETWGVAQANTPPAVRIAAVSDHTPFLSRCIRADNTCCRPMGPPCCGCS